MLKRGELIVEPIRCKVIGSVNQSKFEHEVEDFFNEKGELDVIMKEYTFMTNPRMNEGELK